MRAYFQEYAKRALARSNITNREELAQYMGDLRTLFYKSTESNYHKQYNEIISGHRWIQVSGFVSGFVSFSYVILIHLKNFQFIIHLCLLSIVGVQEILSERNPL